MATPLLAHCHALKRTGRKGLAVLIDPDKPPADELKAWLGPLQRVNPDWLLVGGSLIRDRSIEQLVPAIKAASELPVVLFPGNAAQIVPEADGILLLSLISGRNPDLLIGRHVEAAPLLRHSGLEILPTGYMLIEAGNYTTAHYISNTLPIPREKSQIAMCTALAGELLGLQLIYLDGGSGAQHPVPTKMIAQVAQSLQIPLIVGGGIRSATAAHAAWQAGADLIVIGSAYEGDPAGPLLRELGALRDKLNHALAPLTPDNGSAR
jgi:phosphoglycerol geranylgeranyltransferase